MLLREWDMNVALEVAKEEGWEDGQRETERKNARAMKEEGIDINTISKITGLSAREISRL